METEIGRPLADTRIHFVSATETLEAREREKENECERSFVLHFILLFNINVV